MRYVKSLFTSSPKQQSMLKISLLFKNLQTSRANNSRIVKFKKANFQGIIFVYLFVCISVPLKLKGYKAEGNTYENSIFENTK